MYVWCSQCVDPAPIALSWKAVWVRAEVTESVRGCWDGPWPVCDSESGYGHACEQVGRCQNQEAWSLADS